ncbi:DNA polymerase III subunit delta [Chloroflexota bacterium]
MLYVLIGEDDFSRRQSLEEIRKGVGDLTTLVANTTDIGGQQVTLEQLKAVCETVPFLAERRLVIVEGLMERYEHQGKPNRKNARLTERQNEYKSIADYVNRIPHFTTLVLMDGKLSSRNLLLRELTGKAEIRSFPLLRDAKLRQWIQRRVTEAGGSISTRTVELLAKFVGGNLWAMANEIDKLVLFTNGRCIEEDDVRTVVSYAQEANVFAMVDAILGFKASEAEQLLAQLLQQGAAPAYLLVMLSRQTRILVRVKDLKSQGKSRKEIQEKLNITWEFVFRKALEQADKYSFVRLKEVYHKLLEADISIKTGRYDGELALNILIAELCQGSRI